VTPSEQLPRARHADAAAEQPPASVEAPELLRALAPAPAPRSIESVLEKRWARLLIPSLSDLYFVAILAWVFMGSNGAGWSGLLADADAGWHIRTGEYILDHQTVPYQDLYSFSKPGAPWYAWEWLADVVYGGLFRWAGLKGVVLAAGVLIAVFATTLVRRMIWGGVHLLMAMLVSLLGIGASSIHFLARPHVFTLLLTSVTVWMIEADRKRPTRWIWLLVPLTVVWTNLHGGFLALIAVLGLTAIGTGVEAWLGIGRTLRDAVRYTKLTAACAAASLINPYGWNLHLHVQKYLRSDWIRNLVQEFQSPSFRQESMLQFEVLLVAGLLATAALLRRRRIVESLWIVFWAHMALGSVRHVPVFVAVASPAIAWEMGSWWSAWTARSRKSSVPGILNQMAADAGAGFRRTSLLPWLVVAALMALGQPIRWPKDFPPELFPTRMVHEHLDLIAGARVLTTDQWGDYLIFTNPGQKVFIDGRSDFYGAEVGRDFLRLTNGHWQWRELMAKYDFDVVLMETSSAIVQLLKQEPDWHVIADDGKHILLARN
jgi:hypothetical protein